VERLGDSVRHRPRKYGNAQQAGALDARREEQLGKQADVGKTVDERFERCRRLIRSRDVRNAMLARSTLFDL